MVNLCKNDFTLITSSHVNNDEKCCVPKITHHVVDIDSLLYKFQLDREAYFW